MPHATPDTSAQASAAGTPAPSRVRTAVGFVLFNLAVVALAVGMGWHSHSLDPAADSRTTFYAEHGPFEWLQVVVWLLAAGIAAVAAARGPLRRDRLNAIWLGALALAAGARELDLHERIDADHWDLGVSFMLNWWTDPDVSILRKAAWAAVGAVIAIAVLLPPLLVRAPLFKLLARVDAATLLFLAAGGWLFLGYAADDLFGRGQFVSKGASRGIEEAVEFAGVVAFALSAWLTLRRPLSVRLA